VAQRIVSGIRGRAQFALTGETSTIYYVLSHSISRFSLKTRMSSTLSYWENLYHLLCAFSFYFSIFFENTHELNSLLLRKFLSFTMCFLILFFDERTEKISIIYYVLSHRVSRRAHYHWKTLYYFVCASSSCSSMSALSLRKSLLFSECFFSYWCSRLDIDSDRDRCQSHFLKHWENLYHLVDAFSSYFSMSALRKLLSFSKCFFIIFLDECIEKR